MKNVSLTVLLGIDPGNIDADIHNTENARDFFSGP